MKNELRALIVDDEKSAMEVLSGLIENFIPEITEVQTCQDALGAIEMVSEFEPDILFLDINMPQLTGFELIEKLEDFHGKIIFTTAYDQYALDAFKVGAFDYLLKPVEIAKLESTVKRYIEDYGEEEGETSADIQALFEALNVSSAHRRTIAVNHRGGMQFLKTKDVLFLKAQGNYTEIVCEDYTYMSTKTLKDVELMLDPQRFVRVHKSYVVNIEQVTRAQLIDNNWYLIINGQDVPISRRRKSIIDQFAV